MAKNKLITCLTIIIIIFFLISGFIFVRRLIAIKRAKNYLEVKYETEVKFEKMRVSISDPWLYWIQFHTITDPNLKVVTCVFPDSLTIPNNADNYLLSLFFSKMHLKYDKTIKAFWGNESYFTVSSSVGAMPFQDTSSVNDKMDISDMSKSIKMRLYIETKEYSEEIDIDEEVRQIIEFTQILQNDNITLDEIIVVYLSETGKPLYVRVGTSDENSSKEGIIDSLKRITS